MKSINFKSYLGLSVMSFTVILSGCISIPTSTNPRFYALSAIDENDEGTARVSARISRANNDRLNAMIIGVGPVKIPEYLNRPQIVTMTADKMLQFAQFDRWGESLDTGIAHIIREDLTDILPGTKFTSYPWNPSMVVKYQVALEVVQLDNVINGDMSFIVQWMVIDLSSSKVVTIKRSEFHKPINPQNYAGLAKTLSMACASLSDQIIEEIKTSK